MGEASVAAMACWAAAEVEAVRCVVGGRVGLDMGCEKEGDAREMLEVEDEVCCRWSSGSGWLPVAGESGLP